MNTRFPCPCCRCRTLSESPPGTFEICAVCGWEDDIVESAAGANAVSLLHARETYQQFGASEKRLIDMVRPPTEDERPLPGDN
ncbi:MAG: hypothetical protein IPQ07_11445 [Myxococcales bacterium]|nr:hypothetical protein [Myxococcales bacterium]